MLKGSLGIGARTFLDSIQKRLQDDSSSYSEEP